MILRALGFLALLVCFVVAAEESCQTDLIHAESVEEAVRIASKSVAYAGMKGDIKEGQVEAIPMDQRLLVQLIFTDGFVEDNAARRLKWLRYIPPPAHIMHTFICICIYIYVARTY